MLWYEYTDHNGYILNEKSKRHRSNKDSCRMYYTEYVERRKLLK